MKKEITQTEVKLKELFSSTSFECYQYEGFESAEELIDAMREKINQDKVTYYNNAMKYLIENDSSLSELLATLLQQQNLNKELNGLVDEIEEIFNALENIEKGI